MKVFDLGLIDFSEGLRFQEQLFNEVRCKALSCAMIVCSHHPVITVGRSAQRSNILAEESRLLAEGIKVVPVSRGGDVTYHGPGQMVVYPICDLGRAGKDIHGFLRFLEGLLIGLLGELGIEALQRKGLTGVWVGEKKIASIGIAVKQWITFHGLALNITRADLKNFSLIRPCGMDIGMTCVEEELGRSITDASLKEALLRRCANDQGYFT